MHLGREWDGLTASGYGSSGTHGMVLQVALNVGKANEHEPVTFTDHDTAFLTDVATALDGRDLRLQMERFGVCEGFTIRDKQGAKLPVVMDARHTGVHNMTISVRYGWLTDKERARADEEEREHHDGYTWGDLERTGAQVAIIHDVRRVYAEGYTRGRDGSEFGKAARLRYRSDLAHLVVGVWDHYRRVLGVEFDVIERNAPVIREEEVQLPFGMRRLAYLEIETLRERTLRLRKEAAALAEQAKLAAEQAALEAGENAKAKAKSELEAAYRLVVSVKGDAKALVVNVEISPNVPGMGLAIAKALGELGVKAAPAHSWDKVFAIRSALDLTEPGWRDEPRVAVPLERVVPVRELPGRGRPTKTDAVRPVDPPVMDGKASRKGRR